MVQIINVTSKKEIISATTDVDVNGHSYYKWFKGDIRKGNRYVKIGYYYIGNNIHIEITYWEDGKDVAVEFASHCTTAKGVVNKVSKFLNVK